MQENKESGLKKMGLFQLLKQCFLLEKKLKQLDIINEKLEKNITSLKGIPDFSYALDRLHETETLLTKGRVLSK